MERVLVLQPAIPTRQKFQWAQQQRLQQRLSAALAEAQQHRADLVVLPEGALGLEPRLAEPVPVELISGGFRWQELADSSKPDPNSNLNPDPEQRSALLRLAPGDQQPRSWLDKHRLVPLGEWVPLAGLIRWSGLSAVGGIQPGSPSRLLARPAGAIAGAICYELSDGSALAAASAAGAGWLLASANLDPYPLQLQQQFQALAQLRAIETGRWLVSAANTGPSLLVNARGRVLEALPPGRPATGVFAVPRLEGLTPYDRWREVPLLVLVLGAAGWRWRRRS
jgi:apolipoprotein N-acyltransferase